MKPILLNPPVTPPAAEETRDDAAQEPVLLQRAEPAADGQAEQPEAATGEAAGVGVDEPIALHPAGETSGGSIATIESAPAEPVQLQPQPGIIRRVGRGIASGIGWLFGAITLIGGLAFLAAIPILQFLSLGYLLEAAGRIGRTGRLRDAFPGVRLASKIGGAVLGSWLVILPWRFAATLLTDAELIDPSSPQALFLRRLVAVLTIAVPLHIVFALSRGGQLRYFFWPFNFVWFIRRLLRGGYFREAWTSCLTLLEKLRRWHYFSLGLRGAVGAFLWLAIPSTLYWVGREVGLFLLGGLLMTIVVLYVPFLQVHFAAENRFRAMFELGAVRERFRRAPIAFFIAFLFTLVMVLPLYLLKIEVVPRDAMWLPSLVFIVTIFPLKVMTGWAYGRAGRRPHRAHWTLRVLCRMLMLPIAVFYAFFVFFTQYTGWHGIQALYEHHAFLLPVPF